jgi:two-component SAPR family response regulator
MSFEDVLIRITESFAQHGEQARVILIHARSRYRAALVSRLIDDENLTTFYYAMGTEDNDVPSFVAGFTHDLAEQYPTFGARINQVGIDDPNRREELLRAFAADLDELSDGPYLLLLDEFDRADVGDDLQAFFEDLIDIMPEKCRMVISSRDLPRLPWMSLIAQKKAVMLRDAELIASDFYENQAKGQARLEVEGFGPGQVLLDGQPIEGWEGHLPRLLFFFALERPVVTRSEICQSFWTDLNNDQAVNVFHVTKRRLHKALDHLGLDVLVHENGYYRVNPELSIHYDVVDFVGALVEGRTTTGKQQQAAWQRAIELYSRPFLQGHNEAWIVKRRQEYQTGYLEALSGMAGVRKEEGRPETALQLLQKAVNEDPRRQDLHRQVMSLYAELGRRSETASHYQRLQESLQNYGLSMDQETVELYDELMEA